MSKEHLQSHYDRHYGQEKWRFIELHPDAMTTTRLDEVARLLRGAQGNLLEVGCGSGRLIMALAPQFDHLTGIDLSTVRINLANQALRERYPQYAEKVMFVCTSADERFPFEDESFDVVVACAVLEHVVDVFFVMDEIARVCRPGGQLVLEVPNICYLKNVKDLLLGRVPLTGSPTRDMSHWRNHGWDGDHLHNFSKASLADLLRNVGFEPEKWSGTGRLAKLRRWCQYFVGDLAVRARRRT